MVGDVKCYHCGHISGQIQGTRTDRLVFDTFKPRQGYKGKVPKRGERILCERCQGPVFLEELRQVLEDITVVAATRKRTRTSRGKAA